MGVTRADVAAAAGTSTAVVSYVLNDGPRPVADATRRRVLEAVERLGYRPNALAAGLSARRTKLVGLVVPDLTIPFFAQITDRLAHEGRRRGLTVLTATSAWDVEREAAVLEELIRLRVRGLCLAPATETAGVGALVRGSGTPAVLLTGDPGEPALPRVTSDAVAAGRLATRHLLEHGFSDVVCLTVGMGGSPVGPRVEGWRRELAERAPGARHREVPVGIDRYRAEAAAAEVLAGTSAPVAIMATTDEIALGVLAAAARLGRRVPEDCAVVGCDGIPEGRLARPPLTTVAEPVDALCATALDVLLADTVAEGTAERGEAGGEAGDEAGDEAARIGPLPVSLRLGGSCGSHAGAELGLRA